MPKKLGISIRGFSPIENRRSSFEELERIKKYSDENLKLIESKLTTSDEEEKRNVIINLISAFDYYIHEIVIWGVIQITLNKFPEGKRYKELKVSVTFLKDLVERDDVFDNSELKEAIINDLSRETYQQWERVKRGLEVILPADYMKKVSDLTSGKAGKALFQTVELNRLVERRNILVHHFDRNYTNASKREIIDFDCVKSFELIKLIIESIHKIILEYDSTEPE